MFRRSYLIAFVLSAVAAALCAADNTWSKVQELRHGTEIRVLKKGVREPILATLDEANAERILIVTKTAQLVVAKEDVDRLDARPARPAASRKPAVESTAKTVEPDYTPRPQGSSQVPTTSYGSSVNFGGSKPDFETIYRRPPAAPAK
jgi:hypothetical protein